MPPIIASFEKLTDFEYSDQSSVYFMPKPCLGARENFEEKVRQVYLYP
jgi:hypothetical protein